MNKEVDMPTPWSSVSSRAFKFTLAVAIALAGMTAAFLPLALTHRRASPATTGTFKTQYLLVDTDGQNALFSTFSNGLGAIGNVWIGGGGASFSGPNVPGTGADTALGTDALFSATTAFGDTAVGWRAARSLTTGYTTTAIGYGALTAATTAVDNTSVGYRSSENVTTGCCNTFVGTESMGGTTAFNNTGIGLGAGALLTTGNDNTALGTASRCGTTGTFNTCVGSTSGAGIQGAASDVAIGPFTLQAATSAQGNVAIGSTSLTSDTTGQNNTAVGLFSCTGVTTGSENACVGDHSCAANNVTNSSALGAFALQNQTAGFNVGVGYLAGATITSGVANTVVGYNDTTGITIGNSNTILGSNIGGLAAGTTGNIILADGGGNIRLQSNGVGRWTINGIDIISSIAPTSVNHGAFGTSSTDWTGDVTGIGANTSVTVTYSTAFPTGSRCQASPLNASVAIEQITAVPIAASVTFSCTAIVAGIAANCDDFTYTCVGY